MTDPRAKVRVVPTTFPKANAYVGVHHRHHAPLPGGFAWFCLAAVADGVVCGIAIAGRPTNRNNDNGQTIEVLRLATDGTANACSALLGACARVANAMGAERIITYTLDAESGASVRGAGWTRDAEGITSWWTHAGSRTPAVTREHHGETKVRWSTFFRDPLDYEWPEIPADEPATLFN